MARKVYTKYYYCSKCRRKTKQDCTYSGERMTRTCSDCQEATTQAAPAHQEVEAAFRQRMWHG